jgi:hypothetical protein
LDKPVVMRLDITDLRRAVDDAAFRALVEKGWTVLTSVVIADDEGQYIHLVMVPPRDADAKTTPVPLQNWLLGVVLGIGAFAVYALLVQ